MKSVRIKSTYLSKRPPVSGAQYAMISTILFVLAITMYQWGSGVDLSASGDKIFGQHEYWRALTAVLVHADMKHFLANSIFLGIFSYMIYGYFGFAVFPVGMMVGATLTNLVSIGTYDPQIRLVGASGLVYLMAGFWLTVYGCIDRKRSFPRRLMNMVGVALVVFFPTSFQVETSYRTHFIGLALGVLAGLIVFQKNKEWLRAHEVFEIDLEDEELKPEDDDDYPGITFH